MRQSIAVSLVFAPILVIAARGAPPLAGTSDNSQQWVAIAAELTASPDGYGFITTNGSASRKVTREAAEAKAMEICRSGSKNPDGCALKSVFNKGCMYLATGNNPGGDVGWGAGITPQSAYDACHARNLDCSLPVIGGCSDYRNDADRSKVTVAPKATYWAALAAGTGENSTTKFVRTGMDLGPTRQIAAAKSVAKCNEDGAVSCKLVGAFNTGCGYVANATSSPSEQLQWATGTTAQAAYDKCQSTGATCDTKTIGYCFKAED